MSGPAPATSNLTRLWQAVVVLLATAFAARLVWELLKPLLPILLLVGLLVAIYGWFRRP
jgi:NhaP-type Na+/H+ or K+/H+ antiporter